MKALLIFLVMTPLFADVRLSEKEAARFVDLAMAGLDREFPNKPGHVFLTGADVKSPSEVTPVFYGHFDWHSSVHGHWTLVRLVRLFPEAEWVPKVRAALAVWFSEKALQKEADYLTAHKAFERMYGWAWALRLGIELRALDDEQGKDWAKWYEPVETAIVANAREYLPKLTWPVRCGFHPESSFPMGQMIDWARATGDEEFESLLVGKAKEFYGKDKAYPVRYEPSGNDFFSPGLNEADLMRRVLPRADFQEWFVEFFPGLELGNLRTPVTVSDFSDGHLVHLVGLNLSRAWTMRGIASVLDGEARKELLKSSLAHERAGLRDTFSGHYEGDHWLGTFAVYLMTQ